MLPDTITVISEAVFTANHLTDTDKQNLQENKLNTTKKQHKTQQNKPTLVQSPFMKLGRNRYRLIIQRPRAHKRPNWTLLIPERSVMDNTCFITRHSVQTRDCKT